MSLKKFWGDGGLIVEISKAAVWKQSASIENSLGYLLDFFSFCPFFALFLRIKSGHYDLNLGVPKIGSIIQLFGTSNRMKIYPVVFSIDSKNSNPEFQYLNLSSLVLRNKL